MGSTYEHGEVVTSYLAREFAASHLLGPFSHPLVAHLQTSSFGVIPKRQKWQLIVDLSSPEGHMVNEGIDSNTCSLTYISVEKTSPTPSDSLGEVPCW